MAISEELSPQTLAAAARAAAKGAKGPQAKLLQAFIAAYYQHIPAQDLAEFDAPALGALARAHMKTGDVRTPKSPNVRVYNPSLKRDGWACDHSVVEIITDDMPFLVDSVSAELTRRELPIHLVIHPIFKVRRNKSGKMSDILERGHRDTDARSESFMHFQIAQLPDTDLTEIAAAVEAVLTDVRAAVEDWRPMRERMEEAIEDMSTRVKGVQPEEVHEIRELLRWLHDNHFTFLGFREFTVSGSGKKAKVSMNRTSGLGVLRNPDVAIFEEYQQKEPAVAGDRRVHRQKGPLVGHENQSALHGASFGSYGRHRHQENRRKRQRRWAPPVRRAVHLGRI